MVKTNPTIRELQKKIGHEAEDLVIVDDSKVVLKNLHKPVLSYGIGYSGFVAIYKDQRGYARGTSFSIQHPHTYNYYASFSSLSPYKADRIIRTEKNITEKQVLKKPLEKENPEGVKTENLIGYVEYLQRSWDGNWLGKPQLYEIYKLKNGKYEARKQKKIGRMSWFLESYENIEKGLENGTIVWNKDKEKAKKNKEIKAILLHNTLTQKDIEELQTQAMLNNIND